MEFKTQKGDILGNSYIVFARTAVFMETVSLNKSAFVVSSGK
jgi:hypothetical protein